MSSSSSASSSVVTPSSSVMPSSSVISRPLDFEDEDDARALLADPAGLNDAAGSDGKSSMMTPLEEEGVLLSDILPSDVPFCDERVSKDFAKILRAQKFPLRTLKEIAESGSPHANNAQTTLNRDGYNYQILADIFNVAMEADGLDPPPLHASKEESVRREFCGPTCVDDLSPAEEKSQ